jgi:hypothetical protein
MVSPAMKKLASAVFLAAGILHAAGGPTIEGTLRSEEGMPVGGSVYFWQADVPCTSTPSGVHCNAPIYYSVNSDSEGQFHTPVVQPLRYYFQASASGLLNIGTWDRVGVVDVRDASPVRNLAITLRRAAGLVVRVNDPHNLFFHPCASPASCSNLIIGIRFGATFQAFLGATAEPRDADGGIDYRLPIPFDTPLRLWVFTRDYFITDESGVPINTEGPNAVFTVPRDTCTKRFILNITGRRG